ncbi:MAG: UDP-3-O-3-hydroxymyristoyl glucosamine, partial [Chitinophagaceae bacterium]
KIGNHVMIGGQAGISGHISIADGSKINGKSGVTKTIKEPNKSFNGHPAYDFAASMRVHALSRTLPEMEKRIKELEKMVQQLLSERVNA